MTSHSASRDPAVLRARTQAASALRAALGDRPRIAHRVLGLLYGSGAAAMAIAVAYWCDQLIACTPAVQHTTFTLAWRLADDGRVTGDPAQVSPQVRWASDVLAARAGADTAALAALMTELPGDPQEIAQHITTLLELVARTMRDQITSTR